MAPFRARSRRSWDIVLPVAPAPGAKARPNDAVVIGYLRNQRLGFVEHRRVPVAALRIALARLKAADSRGYDVLTRTVASLGPILGWDTAPPPMTSSALAQFSGLSTGRISHLRVRAWAKLLVILDAVTAK